MAQDVERVLPELVREDEEGYKVVRYNEIPLLLLQTLRELKAENDTLGKKYGDREKQLEELRSRLARLEARQAR